MMSFSSGEISILEARPVRAGWLFLAAAIGLAGSARAAEIVVTNATDVVDGDTTSVDALRSNPGPDGVSLREAVTAADATEGPTTIAIDPSLAGQTIALASDLPAVTRDGVSILGPADAAGRPRVTITGSPFRVFASHFRAAGLRLTAARGAVFFVFAGSPEVPDAGTIEDVRIEDDVFDGGGAPDVGHGIAIGTADGSGSAVVRDVTIGGNAFLGFRGDVAAVLCEAGGTDGAIRGVSVAGNSFVRNSIAVRFGVGGTRNTVSRLTISGNDFLDNDIAVAAISGGRPDRPPPADGVVEQVLIARDRIRGGDAAAIYLLGGAGGARGLVLRDVDVVDDVLWRTSGFAIAGEAGSGAGSAGNRIEDVRIVNDTFAGPGPGLAFYADSYGAVGNSVSDVTVVNAIFAGKGAAFAGDVLPSLVSHSLLADPGFAGVDGNLAADPVFVDPARGDFHLRAGSAAIGRGLVDGAPCVDLDGNARLTDGKVDIGAYEFGASFRARPCPVRAVEPPQAAPIAAR